MKLITPLQGCWIHLNPLSHGTIPHFPFRSQSASGRSVHRVGQCSRFGRLVGYQERRSLQLPAFSSSRAFTSPHQRIPRQTLLPQNGVYEQTSVSGKKVFHGKHYCPSMASMSKPAFQVGGCNTAKTIAQEWPAFLRYLSATCWPDCEKGRTD